MRVRFLAALLLVGFLAPAAAQDIRPFARGSYAQILAAHKGQPFILSLWSLDCVYCRDDFALFEKLARTQPALDVVLVATDTPAQDAAIASMLRHYRLQDREAWVFDDSFVERLRFEVDKHWYGELPRTYLFAGDGTRKAVSGRLDEASLLQWAQRQAGKD